MSPAKLDVLLVVVGLAGGQLLACSGCSESSAKPTGATDSGAGGPDAHLDAPHEQPHVDAPHDVVVDVASEVHIDAPAPDVEVSMDGGIWESAPYAAFSQCPLQQLGNPATVSPYPWISCENVPTGCQLLDTSTIPGSKGRPLTFVGRVGGSDEPRFALVRRLDEDVLSPTLFRFDGSIEAAWAYRMSEVCAFQVQWIGNDEVAVAIAPTESAMMAQNIAWRVWVGTAPEILTGTAEQYDLKYDVYNLNAIEQLSVSDTLVVADGQPGGRLFVALRPDGSFEEVPQQGALWGEHLLVDSELVASAYEGRGNLHIRHADATIEAYKADPDRGETGPGGSSGILAWQEGVNGTLTSGYERVELWSAPFTTDPASLSPEKLMELPNTTTMPIQHGEGWYVVWLEPLDAASNSPVRIVQLPTGKYIDLAPPTGYAYTELVGVAGGEAWFLLREYPGSKNPVTIARIELSGLESMLQ